MTEITKTSAESIVEPMRIVLHNISRAVYEMIRAADVNHHVHMTYFHGTLELMSPGYASNPSAWERLPMNGT